MNKHIELVKKWLADPDSVTQQELEVAADAADAATWAANAAYATDAAYAANAAYAAYGATADDSPRAAYWVKKYEESTK